MRSPASLAAFALFLAVPVWAQHGGGGHGGGGGHAGGGGGGRAGFSGGASSHISGGVHSGATHSTPGVARGLTGGPSFAQRGRSSGPFLHNDFRGPHVHTFGLRNYCYGYGCRSGYIYPYAYGGYYDPYWFWDDGSSYDNDYDQNVADASAMNQQSLEEQQMLRQEEMDGDQDLYARSAPRVATTEEPGASIIPATILVFRDQHKQEIQNYAIVGQTLWNFASPHTEKIPLTDLDLAATMKANDERGLTFRVPSPNEAQ
jgi:hypothetical protein